MASTTIESIDVLALLLSNLDIKFKDISDYLSIRKKIQKSIYILQQPRFDFDLGYRYDLYLAGPYSTELSNEYYIINENIPHFNKLVNKYKLSRTLKEKINEFITIFNDDYDLLECVATLHFLYNITFAYIRSKKLRRIKCKMYLRKIKPHFRRKVITIRKAFSIVRTL